MKINPINYSYYPKVPAKTKKEQHSASFAPVVDNYQTGAALKSQILFRGNYRNSAMKEFQKEWNLDFCDTGLLNNAFIYDILGQRSGKHNQKTNQEITIVGEGVFKLCTDILIYRDYPLSDAGELTRNAQALNKEKYAKKLKLNNLALNYDFFNTSVKNKKLFEALIGAIYLSKDKKEEGLRDVLDFFDKNLYQKTAKDKKAPLNSTNFKDLLYKYVGKKYRGTRKVIRETIKDGKIYKCSIFIDEEFIANASAKSTKGAEEQASKIAFEYLYEKDPIDMDAKKEKYVACGKSKFTPQEFKQNLREFQNSYGLNFSNQEMLEKIFEKIQHIDFRRLEFLGDGILDFCIIEFLLEKYPQKNISEIHDLKMNIVSNENLAKIAHKMNFTELKNDYGLPVSEKKYADMVEALLGAILVDGKENGLKDVNNFFEKLRQKGIMTL